MSILSGVRRQETEVRMKTENRKTRMVPAQPDSKMSNFGLGEHCPRKGRKTHTGGILTIKIKNIQGWFMGRWRNEPMSKMQNGPAQRDSIMSNLKIETENSLPQRYSKMILIKEAREG
jgi:hypothetical protein